MSSGKRAGFSVVLALAILGGCLSAAWADTLYVNGVTGDDAWDGLCEVWDGGTCGPKATIQAGIDAAVAGDEVVLADATYTGAGNKDLDFLGKAITVRSASGDPALCVIDCEGDGRGFHFHSGEGADSVVTGLTITGGYVEGDGGGVHCLGSSPTLNNCLITGNSAAYGGAIYCRNSSSLTIAKSRIIANSANRGGGVYCHESHPTFTACTIAANVAGNGGGVVCYAGSNPTLTNCTIVGNSVDGRGAGLQCDFGSGPMVTNCILWADKPDEIYVSGGGTAVVAHCDVQGGWSGDNVDVDPQFAFPGDYHLMPTSPCIDAGTNTPPGALPPDDADGNARPLDGDGDSVAVADMGAYEFNPAASSIALHWDRFEFFGAEGGDDPPDQTLWLRNSGAGTLDWQISGEPAWLNILPSSGTSSGEVDAVTLSVHTDGLAHGTYNVVLNVVSPGAVNSPRNVTITLFLSGTRHVPSEYPTIQAAIDVAIAGDVVEVADGRYTGVGNKNLDFGGKAITVRSASGDPTRCIIDCQRGGRGFYFHRGEGPASVVAGLTIMNAYVDIGDPVDNSGGGLYCVAYSSPTIANCILRQNEATGAGGGVYCSGSDPTFSNCTIRGNSASIGGGLYCIDSSAPTFTNSTLYANSANDCGAFLCMLGGNPTFTNCILWGNSGQNVCVDSHSSSVLTYCDVEGGWAGAGNIDADPLFAFADDLHLTPESPCIDAGSNAPVGGLPSMDPDGNPRPLDGNGDAVAIADMGAYEFNAAAPSIVLSPAEFEFFAPEGGPAPDDQTLRLRNGSAGLLGWQISGQPAWLTVSPTSGESAGEEDLVILSADTAGLPNGTYAATLEVTAPGAVPSVRVVHVVLHVIGTLHVPGEYATIQAAIDVAADGDVVELAVGTYVGVGNKALDFHGKAVTVRSASGDPAACIIDCEGDGRGFYFHTGEGPDSVVAGLTITNGNAAGGSGGGIYCRVASPTIMACIIGGNSGGGIDCASGSARLDNCTISGNSGRGVYCSGSTLNNCTISGNSGRGVYCSGNATLTNCVLRGNRGGGMDCREGSPTLTDCTIDENTTGSDGGGIVCNGGNPTLTHCTIRDNVSAQAGGAVYCYGGHPLFVHCTISGNSADEDGGGIVSYFSAPTLTSCTISANAAAQSGGGVYGFESDGLTLAECVISANSAASGAGVCCYSSSATLTNCLIDGNSAKAAAGGIECTSASPVLTNCTLSGNWARFNGGAARCASGGDATFSNCILWGNAPQEIYVSSATPVLAGCDIRGGWAGEGNIDADPLFVDADGADDDPNTWADNDYRLAAGSPCIDAGSNAAVPAGLLFDLDGLPRITDGDDDGIAVVDMGAYERPATLIGDMNCDGVVDFGDINPFVQALMYPDEYAAEHPGCPILFADCSGDGVVGFADINPFIELLLGP